MNRFWEHILLPIATASKARTFCEIGTDRGALTEKVLAHCREVAGVLHAIDPSPNLDVEECQARHGERLVFHRAYSINALQAVGPVDFVLIDGDHNWFTMLSELRLIERIASERGVPLPIIAMHDVAWPYARRDLYYDPAAIPDDHRQPFARQGIRPDSSELVDGGLNAHLHNAAQEGGPANGVLTAVEDYLAEASVPWRFASLPGLHGLGVLVDEARLERQPAVGRALDHLDSVALLRRHVDVVEQARILAEIRAADEARRRRRRSARRRQERSATRSLPRRGSGARRNWPTPSGD